MQDMLTDNAIHHFMNRLRGPVSSRLLLDYDGTLAPFHTDRFQAYPYSGVIPVLESIIRSGKTEVIVISGRPVREVQALLHPLEHLEIWGAHGLEHLLRDGSCRQAAIEPEIAKNLAQAEEWLKAAGLLSLAEIKPGGIAAHWRGRSDAEIAKIRVNVNEGWAPLAEQPGLKLLHFDGGVELRVTRPDKGDAMIAILQELKPDVPIAFLGDDFTDEDGFKALDDRGLSVLVRPEYRKTAAKAWIKPPHELIAFLEQWLACISA